MSPFWEAMAPWLTAAAMLPGVIILSLRIMPSDEWAARVIVDWAESEGLAVESVEKARWLDRLYGPSTWTSYRLRVRDKAGHSRECKAVVGRFMLWRTAKNLRITWIEPPEGDA